MKKLLLSHDKFSAAFSSLFVLEIFAKKKQSKAKEKQQEKNDCKLNRFQNKIIF